MQLVMRLFLEQWRNIQEWPTVLKHLCISKKKELFTRKFENGKEEAVLNAGVALNESEEQFHHLNWPWSFQLQFLLASLTQDMKGKALKVIKDGIEMQPGSPVAEVDECAVDKGVLRPFAWAISQGQFNTLCKRMQQSRITGCGFQLRWSFSACSGFQPQTEDVLAAGDLFPK